MGYFCCMNLLSLAFKIFLIYVLYKLVFDLIIPLYKSTKRIRRQFTEMQQKMQNEGNRQAAPQFKPTTSESESAKEGEYIEFEEVKETGS